MIVLTLEMFSLLRRVYCLLTVDFDLLFVTVGIANDHIHGHRAAAN